MCQSWCEANQGSRAYIVGHAYLKSGEAQKAQDWMLSSQHGLHSEPFLQDCVKQMTARGDGDSLEACFFMKVLTVFEQSGQSEHVVDLATLAISQADDGDPMLPILYALLFKHRLLLGDYDEAYSAMLANPDTDSQLDCLRQLVVVLMENGELETLVKFPYNTLHQQVVNILESRSRSVDLSVVNYYSLLYSFHIHRSDYRKAACTMYESACRFAQEVEGVEGLRGQARSCLAALNALRLVDPAYAWVVRPHILPRQVAEQEEEDLELLGPAPPSRSFMASGTARRFTIVQLKDIEKEHLLVTSRIRLFQVTESLSVTAGGPWGAEETARRLAGGGLFEDALAVAQAYGLSLAPVMAELAARCVSLSEAGSKGLTQTNWKWLQENPSAQMTSEAGVADEAWELLRVLLERHVRASEDRGVLRAVAERVLARGRALPGWLVKLYRSLGSDELLRVFLSRGLLEPATALALDMIDAVSGIPPLSQQFNVQSTLHAHESSVWLPHCQLEVLQRALKQTPGYEELFSELQTKLDHYLVRADQTGRDMALYRIRSAAVSAS